MILTAAWLRFGRTFAFALVAFAVQWLLSNVATMPVGDPIFIPVVTAVLAAIDKKLRDAGVYGAPKSTT